MVRGFLYLSMKIYRLFPFILLFTGLGLNSCNANQGKTPPTQSDSLPKKNGEAKKPPSSFQDTLKISGLAAVFFSPDSLQLEKIKSAIGPSVFEATMHEYENQFRVSHIELAEQWKKLPLYEATRYRYLQFIRNEAIPITLDLNRQGDPCGLYIFDPKKLPQLVDMMNAGSQLYYYFNTK